MRITFKTNTSTKIVIYVVILIIIGIFGFGFIKDKYIIYKTKSTFNILNEAYQKTLKTTDFKWNEKDMSTTVFAQKFVKNLPTKTVCEYSNQENCFPKYINFKNPPEGLTINRTQIGDYYKVKLKNNVCVAFNILSPTCSHTRERCGTIFIDINCAQKGPNKFGEDLYDFGIYKNGIRTYIIEANHNQRCLNGTGQGCAAYMFKYKNRNYKKYDKYVTKELNEKVKKQAKEEKRYRRALTR